MRATIHQERKLTHLDFTRLRKLAAAAGRPELAELLNEADLLDSREIPPDIVTMYAQFVVREGQTQRRRTLAVCYPPDAEPGAGYISVLSPVGMSLLGLRVGDTAHWTGPTGEESFAEVEQILFQPEATGDFVT